VPRLFVIRLLDTTEHCVFFLVKQGIRNVLPELQGVQLTHDMEWLSVRIVRVTWLNSPFFTW